MAATAMIAFFFSVSVSCLWYGSSSDDECVSEGGGES